MGEVDDDVSFMVTITTTEKYLGGCPRQRSLAKYTEAVLGDGIFEWDLWPLMRYLDPATSRALRRAVDSLRDSVKILDDG